MRAVSLVYLDGCPNVAAARTQLLRAFAAAELTPRWTEHDAGDPELPPHARGFGSPTILVDGKDVTGAGPVGTASCRLYRNEEGAFAGVPPLPLLVAALRPERRPRWRSSIGALPGIVVALLPNLACPACWPAYAALLASLGLGFLLDAAWLLPLTALSLGATLGVLAHRARERRGRGPLFVGLVASALILVAKFVLEVQTAFSGGVALLVGAALWNAWPRTDLPGASCPACVQGAAAPTTGRNAKDKEVTP